MSECWQMIMWWGFGGVIGLGLAIYLWVKATNLPRGWSCRCGDWWPF